MSKAIKVHAHGGSEALSYEDDDPGSLRHQSETAGNVTVGDAFWAGPRDPA